MEGRMAKSAVIENSNCSENTKQRVESNLAAPRLDIDHGLVDVRTRSVENSSLLESRAGLVDSRVSIHGQSDSIQRRDKVSCLQRSLFSGPRFTTILIFIILAQIIGIFVLLAERYEFGHHSTSLSEFDTLNNFDKTEALPKYFVKPRCFSMCESPDIFYRDDKLIKTIVTYSSYGKLKHQPVRYYMFLFPDPPIYTEAQVNQPLILTPFIKSGEINKARELSRVIDLENFDMVESYSGFITVNETFNSNIFFWFFPAESGNTSAPVILWLQGGPGSTGLYGLLKENGPFMADVDSSGMPFTKENPYGWSKKYSVIYVDNPVGTGFSFTEDSDGYPNYIENSTDHLYIFLQQFYTMFPEQQPNSFYTFGESYGGKYAPQLALKIHEENLNLNGNIRINLEGIGVGNGWMSPGDQGRYATYLFYHGLIDKNQFEQLNRIDDKIVNLINSGKWDDAWKSSDEQLDFILTALNYSSLYDMTKDQYHPSTMNFWFWVEQMNVRRSIHVGNQTFSDGLDIYMAMVGDTMRSIKPTLQKVLKYYKVLAYHGALDIICHYPGVEEMFRNTEWPGKDEFHRSQRHSFWAFNQETHENDLAGYYKKGGNLSLFLIRNAGHSVPLNQPQWTLRMVEDFINNKV